MTELEYEELFRPEGSIVTEELAKLSGFLQINSEPFGNLQPNFVKQTSDELSDVITNYAEVVEFLPKTPFSNLLEARQ